MNAYELAKELDDWTDNHEAANMLRQQADKLKASELHEKRGWLYAEELEQERKRQADRIAELEKFITDNKGRMEDYEVWKSIQK